MAGNTITLTGDILAKGWRRDQYVARNSLTLDKVENMRCYAPHGLKPFLTVNQPVTDTELTAKFMSVALGTKVWPYPQLFRGKEVTLLAGRVIVGGVTSDRIFEVTEIDGGTWTLAPIETYKMSDFSTHYDGANNYKVPAATGAWHFADFGPTWILFNGACQVFKTGYSNNVLVQEAIPIKTGCEYLDTRLIYAGFNQHNFRSLAWKNFVMSYLDSDDIPHALYDLVYNALTAGHSAGPNWVAWGPPGAPDMLSLFREDFGVSGSFDSPSRSGYDSDDPWIFDNQLMNASGLIPMPWRGEIVKAQELGNAVVIYGKEGITGLVPVDTALGYKDIGGFGTRIGLDVNGRGCAGGDEKDHIFIDSTGDLWAMGADLNADKLGYSEIFGTMTPGNIMISLDKQQREFYIGDGLACYMLNSSGLSKCPWMPSTVSFAITDTPHVYVTVAGPNGVLFTQSPSTTVATVWIHDIDCGDRDVHVLSRVRIATTDTNATGWYISILWRMNKAAAYALAVFPSGGTTMPFDKRGNAWVTCQGTEFQIRLLNTDRTKCDLERVEIDVENVDTGVTASRRLL